MASEDKAQELLATAKEEAGDGASPLQIWTSLQDTLKPSMALAVHQWCYEEACAGVTDVKPSWVPSPRSIKKTIIAKLMRDKGFPTYEELYEWSANQETREDFWMEGIQRLDIQWHQKPTQAFEGDPANVSSFPGGRLNISDSCFHIRKSEEPALVYAMESDPGAIQTHGRSCNVSRTRLQIPFNGDCTLFQATLWRFVCQ